MTISIGFIPNDRTVMLLQDSEISYQSLGFTQDIINKIKGIDESNIVGIIGDPSVANEIIDLVRATKHDHARDLRRSLEEGYHRVHESKFRNAVLRLYGFEHIREVTQPQGGLQVDPVARDRILEAAQDPERFGLSLMLATNLDRPQLYTINFPGVGRLEDNVKMYAVRGSGSILAIEKMGEELERYKWQPSLSIDEGIDVLMRAGKASESHDGVGGPFDITYVTKTEEGKNRVVKLDQKKLNMVMYLFPLPVDQETMMGCIARLKDSDLSSGGLAHYIKEKIGVGIEFDTYFRLE